MNEVMEAVYRTDSDRNLSDSTNLLISILVRYPQVGSLQFDSRKKHLKLTFIIRTRLDEDEFASFEDRFRASICVFALLENQTPQYIDISRLEYDSITLINIERDLNTLSQAELSLLVNFFCDYFHSSLTYDESSEAGEDRLRSGFSMQQEQMISSMLKKIRDSKQERNVVGFREDGKVMVYNQQL